MESAPIARSNAALSSSAPSAGSWRDELGDILRAFSGGFIVGIPLLYTMELWSIGITAELWKLLLFLGIAFLIGIGLAHSRAGGFKQETTWFSTIEQAVDVAAVGIVGSTVVLAVLNRIAVGDPLPSIIGKIIVQAVPLSIGAAVANAIFGPLGEKSRRGDDDEDQAGDARREFLADLGATGIGSIFLAFSIAPTDEVAVLASELDYPHLLALIGLSLLLSYTIVFSSGYGHGQREQPGLFQNPLTETVFAYVVSLCVAFFALHLFDRIEPSDPPLHVLAMVLVLGLPATVGGAAGRLVV